MKVFTFFEPLASMWMVDEVKLLHLWERNWRVNGYEPTVVNEWWATEHPYFASIDEGVSKLPSVNPQGYDRACFIRWLAVAMAARHHRAGKVLMVDYDVVCLKDIQAFDWHGSFNKEKLLLLQGGCPSLAFGSPDMFEKMAQIFAGYVLTDKDVHDGKPHVSDQTILMRLIEEQVPEIDARKLVPDMGDTDWQKATFVHCANRTLPGEGIPKWKKMQERIPSFK